MNIIINQILIMAILIAVGYFLFKSELIDQIVTRGISTILLKFVIPMTIIESFIQPFSIEKLKQLLIVSFLSIVFIFLMILVANMFLKEDQRIEKYAAIFSNKGFIGIPIIQSLFGSEAIAIVTPIIVISNIFAWTYGMSLLKNQKTKFNIKSFMTNPSIVGLIIGLVFFFLSIELPYPVVRSISYLTSLNTPLAMIIIGTYLASENMLLVFTNKEGYKVSLLRLLVMPLIVLSIMYFLPIDYLTKCVMVVAFAVPSAANTAMFAQLTNSDYSYGAQLVSLTTILSGLTLPGILYLVELVL